MPTTGETLIGLAAAVAAGVAGSAFTVPTRKEPELGWLAVQAWDWERTWFIFNVWNIVVNVILAQAIFGLDTVVRVYGMVSRGSLQAVLISSSLWAAGTLMFGKGVEMSGVALGVGLAMTSQIIFGTALPFMNDPEKAREAFASPKGALIVLGIIIACLGFAVLGRASWLRDHSSKPASSSSLPLSLQRQPSGSDEEKAELKGGAISSRLQQQGVKATVVDSEESSGDDGDAADSGSRKLLLGVAVSLFAGLFSALLQFAFIYGSEVVGVVEGPPFKASTRVSSAIIFTVSTAVNNMVQSVYMAYLVTVQGKWNYLEVEGGSWVQFWQNSGRCLIMALLLNIHIELYGLSQAYLGAMGPVVAWPLIMSLVVLMSQAWGHLLNEWRGAPRQATLMNWASIAVILSAVIVLGAASKFA